MNMANNMPDIGGLSDMIGKLKSAQSDDDVQNLKNQMDSYLEKELGVDMNEFKSGVEDLKKQLETD